jgi:hypothetical protein
VHQIKTISICLAALVFLAGCSDSEPSDSRIKNQILPTLIGCPAIDTVTDFQKINGMLQNDGSYVADVSWTNQIVLSDKDKALYDDAKKANAILGNPYDPAREQAQEQLNNDMSQISQDLRTLCGGDQGLEDFFNLNAAMTPTTERQQYTFIKTDNGWVIGQPQS